MLKYVTNAPIILKWFSSQSSYKLLGKGETFRILKLWISWLLDMSSKSDRTANLIPRSYGTSNSIKKNHLTQSFASPALGNVSTYSKHCWNIPRVKAHLCAKFQLDPTKILASRAKISTYKNAYTVYFIYRKIGSFLNRHNFFGSP